MICQGQRTYQLLWFSKSHNVSSACHNPEARSRIMWLVFSYFNFNILDHREKWKSKNKASKPWKEVKRSSKIIRGIMILSKLILKLWHRTIKSKPLQWFIHFLNESWLFMKKLKAVLNNRKKSQHWERHKRPPMNHLKASPMHIITIPLSNSHCN